MVTEYVKPHMKILTAKTAEIYNASKTAVNPHIIKAQELAGPFYQVFWFQFISGILDVLK